jgi:D-glycero-alpha-D-manno-heptose-7-phosphate kinase
VEVVATAPFRVADAGGWTDTWFAGHGRVCNLAVGPGAAVRASTTPAATATVELAVTAFAEEYRYPVAHPPGRHPLLEAAISRHGPGGGHLSVSVDADVPPGSGLGTSAAVAVALIGALETLAGGAPDPQTVAGAAHVVESDDLGQQSGIQDQLAAAFGGALLITIDEFPDAAVARLPLSPNTWDALGRRLFTVYLGRPHRSSNVHEVVIRELTGDPSRLSQLEPLRRAATDAADALLAGDLDAYGAALAANTEAQASLHPALVDADAHRIIELARSQRASGWKVNGAGGDGGSLTIVSGDDPDPLRRALADRGWPILPLALSPVGLRVEQAL